MLWENDAAKSLDIPEKEPEKGVKSDDSGESDAENEDIVKEDKIADKKISDLEYMEALKKRKEAANLKKTESKSGHGPTKFFTVKVRGLGYNHKKKHVKQFFHPLKAKSIRVPQKIKGIAYVGFKTEKSMNQALIKNKCFLGGYCYMNKELFGVRSKECRLLENHHSLQYSVRFRWKTTVRQQIRGSGGN